MMAILTMIIALAVVLYATAMAFKRRYKMRAEEAETLVPLKASLMPQICQAQPDDSFRRQSDGS